MDYVIPSKVVSTMLDAGAAKAKAKLGDLVIRGFLSGSLLGFATSHSITTSVPPRPGPLPRPKKTRRLPSKTDSSSML